jgi:rhodanese-related sulfurtransferase
MRVQRISPEESQKRVEVGEPVLFLDSRSAAEWEQSNEQLPGSMRVLAAEVPDRLQEIPRDRTIITYCT